MADNTKIEWADATLNFINGCEVLSPGCTNCYAMALAGGRMKHTASRTGLTQKAKSGKPVWNGVVRHHLPHLWQALTWKRPRRIFWNAHGDMFLGAVPEQWIDMQFAVMAATPQHTHMILSKRTKRMRAYLNDPETPRRIAAQLVEFDRQGILKLFPTVVAVLINRAKESDPMAVRWPLPNVWVGTSVEDQDRADMRVPDLLASPAAIRFLSCEPLLGPLDLMRWMHIFWQCGYCRQYFTGRHQQHCTACGKEGGWCGSHAFNARNRPKRAGVPHQSGSGIDWVIVGGESGPGARPMHPEWARSLRQQCADTCVPFLFKQWGDWAPAAAVPNGHGVDIVPAQAGFKPHLWRRWDGDVSRGPRDDESAGEFLEPGILAIPMNKKDAGRLLDGVEHNGMPEVVA